MHFSELIKHITAFNAHGGRFSCGPWELRVAWFEWDT